MSNTLKTNPPENKPHPPTPPPKKKAQAQYWKRKLPPLLSPSKNTLYHPHPPPQKKKAHKYKILAQGVLLEFTKCMCIILNGHGLLVYAHRTFFNTLPWVKSPSYTIPLEESSSPSHVHEPVYQTNTFKIFW